GVGVADGEVGEDLAVDLDVSGFQARDEARIRDVVFAARRVDADDPQAAEAPLPRSAIAERVLTGVQELLVCLAKMATARPGIALRGLEHRVTPLLAVDRTLPACHDDRSRLLMCVLSAATEQSLDVLAIAPGDLRAAPEPARPAARLRLEEMCSERLAAQD